MDAAGLDLTFHGLRHGYATLALSAGVDLKVTQGMLGHSSFGITADLYSHVSERADAAAANKVGALLWPETGTVTPLR
jgi:site-specific recombinase XerD